MQTKPKFDLRDIYLVDLKINKNMLKEIQQYENYTEEKDDFIDALRYFMEGGKINAKEENESDKTRGNSYKS